MTEVQHAALMQALTEQNRLLERLVNATEGAQVMYESVSVGDIAHTIASLTFFQEPAPGDVIETTEAIPAFFQKGLRGLIVRDSGLEWLVEFRYHNNPAGSYRDGTGAEGGRWYVSKDKCVLVSKA